MSHVDILVAEDNPECAQFIMQFLGKHEFNHQLKVVQNGRDALNLLFGLDPSGIRQPEVCPRLILSDFKMPFVSGLELLIKLKSHPQKRLIPVVIFSSSVSQDDIRACYEAGANTFIEKPTDFKAFGQKVFDLCHYWFNVAKPPPQDCYS